MLASTFMSDKRVQVNFRATEAEMTIIRAQADKLGMRIGDFLRFAILAFPKKIQQVEAEAKKRAASLRKQADELDRMVKRG